MQIGETEKAQDVDERIFQLERRITMEWYSKDQLLQDLYNLREIIYILSKKHHEIKDQLNNYYNKIDHLVDQIV